MFARVSGGGYLVGLAFFLPTVVASTPTALLLPRRRFSGLTGAGAICANGLLVSAALLAAHVVPLTFGILTRGTVAAAALLLLGLTHVLTRGAVVAAGPPAAAPLPDGRVSWALAAAGVVVGGIGALAFLIHLSGGPVTGADAVNHHFPQAARWIQTHSLWEIDQFNVDFAGGTYPDNGNIMQLALVLPWRSLFAVRYVGVAFLALAAVAVYAGAIELRAPRATAALAAAAVVATPSVVVPA